MTRFHILILSTATALGLSACAAPSAVPRGYTHHGDTYKSKSSPPSMKVSKAQRQSMGPVQAQQFRDALYDLVDKLTERAGLPPKSVFVMPHEPMNAFYAQVDNDLREALRHMGYRLAALGEDSYAFTYEAIVADKINLDPEEYPDIKNTSFNNVELILKVFDGDGEEKRMLTEQRGHYHITGAEEYFGFTLPAMTSSAEPK